MPRTKISYKAKTMKFTGWTETEYNKIYTSYKKSVANLNKAQGLKVSASQQLYLREVYKGTPSGLSPLQKQIERTSKTQATHQLKASEKTYYLPKQNKLVAMPSKNDLQLAGQELKTRWAGAYRDSQKVRNIIDAMKTDPTEILKGEQSPAETEALLEAWSDEAHKKNDDDSKSVYGSKD